MWILKYDTNEQMNLSMKQNWDIENRLVLPRRRGVGEGWNERLGLSDTNYYTLFFKNILFHYGLSQDIEYSSL